MKDNPRTQFAIGLALIILAVKWIFTPVLSDAYLAWTAPKVSTDGVESVMDIWAAIAPFVDLVIAAIVGLGAYVIKAGEWLIGQIDSKKGGTDELVKAFARAAALNDEANLKKLRVKIRLPYASQQLENAIAEGNQEQVGKLLNELETLSKS